MEKKGNYYRVSQEDFIRRCKDKQIVPIDYSEFVYIDQKTKYTLTCTKHNFTYTQGGQSLVRGVIGCRNCLNEYKSKLVVSDLPTFLLKFKSRFPEKDFDFSKSVYKSASQHIEVTCDKGHTFSAKPNNLMSGHGCSACFQAKKGYMLLGGKEYYLPKCREIHKDFYDYSKTEFRNCKDRAIVTCPFHGDFRITMDNHSQGKGCPKCGRSGFQPQNPATFYILRVTEEVIKFGITNNLDRRLEEIRKKSCYELDVLYKFDFNDGYIARDIESLVIADKSLIKNVVSKADLPSGYTETTYFYNLSKILQIVENFTNALSQ